MHHTPQIIVGLGRRGWQSTELDLWQGDVMDVHEVHHLQLCWWALAKAGSGLCLVQKFGQRQLKRRLGFIQQVDEEQT
jgi:hypothetical protein